jgi:hypothetical protein
MLGHSGFVEPSSEAAFEYSVSEYPVFRLTYRYSQQSRLKMFAEMVIFIPSV